MVNLKLQFPENFFNEEVRDGYKVSAAMKKIWAVELDLLNEFAHVCKKHNIQFFAAGGTLLGAVRHKGIIPWDDDIDVMMLRSEYVRLCEIAPKEFSHPYFFQTEDTDPGSFRGHAQLRNSLTTGILKTEIRQKKRINQGIFIDIFPLDMVPDDINERQSFYHSANKMKMKYREFVDYSYPYTFHLRKNLFLFFSHSIKHFLISKDVAFQKANASYQSFLSSIVGVYKNTNTLQMSPFCLERFTYNKADLQEVIEMPFETLKISVPANYGCLLDKTYGEWRKFVVGGSLHGGVIFDTEKPFTEYIK